jgi:membrane-bound lytic murein transglycosylase D
MRFLLAAAILSGSLGLSGLQAPAPQAAPQSASAAKLRALVEAAEAAKDKDEDLAIEKLEAAESLIDELSDADLASPEIHALVQRLRVVDQSFDHIGGEGEVGLKTEDEVVALTSEELTREAARVKAAEAGVQYDFPIDLNDKVLAWVRAFTQEKKGFMEGALSRGSRFMPMIRQVFAEEGVPQDLAFLAVIESGFHNNARSYAKAVGMWQFMRSTGRIYGLKGNGWVEERRDPVKTTRAAARYLKRLYEISGDWYLALVGYNAGPLTTDRAIYNVESRNFWDLARSRWLRNQTKNYIPEMCAAVLIGRQPERYGLVVPIQPPFVFESVEVQKPTSLTVIAKYSNTDVATLKDLNPELLRGSTPPGSYTLRVPVGKAMPVNRALAGLKGGQRLDFHNYVIRKGDTLQKVAKKFKVDPEDLLSANEMKANQFKSGKHIQVPPPPAMKVEEQDITPPAVKPLEDTPLPKLPNVGGQPISNPAPGVPATDPAEAKTLPQTPAPESPAAPEPPLPASHVVKKGETLFSIAQRYGLDVDTLRRLNKLKRNAIQVGQKLRLR